MPPEPPALPAERRTPLTPELPRAVLPASSIAAPPFATTARHSCFPPSSRASRFPPAAALAARLPEWINRRRSFPSSSFSAPLVALVLCSFAALPLPLASASSPKKNGATEAAPSFLLEIGCAELLLKASHRRRFRIVYVELLLLLRHFQHFLECRSQVAHLHRHARLLRAVLLRHQRAQPRPVDIRHVVHIQCELLLALRQLCLHMLAQRIAL